MSKALAITLANCVFPTPGGPSISIGFPSKKDKYNVVEISLSGT